MMRREDEEKRERRKGGRGGGRVGSVEKNRKKMIDIGGRGRRSKGEDEKVIMKEGK